MKPAIKKYKHINLGPAKVLWKSDHEFVKNTFLKGDPMENFGTICFKIPTTAARYIETIWYDGQVVFEQPAGKEFNTGILAGGGRFIFRRRWYNRKIVAIEIEIRDFNFRSHTNPTFEVNVRL